MTGESKPQVLIVDDEPLIRLSAINVARDAGYDTLAASSYEQAMGMLDSNAGVGILFTDIRMPGNQDGLELARKVQERWPHIGVIVTSGHLRGIEEEGRMIFLSKPYSPDELTSALHQLA